MSPASSASSAAEFHPLGAVGAIIFPGLGHVLGGRVKRGVLIGLGVVWLFFGGLLIAGIDAVDSRESRLWFIGQAFVGPLAFGVDALHQARFKVIDPNTGARRPALPDEFRDPATGRAMKAGPGQRPPHAKSLGKVNELGALFSMLAGMMNLIAIIDAAFPARRSGRRA